MKWIERLVLSRCNKDDNYRRNKEDNYTKRKSKDDTLYAQSSILNKREGIKEICEENEGRENSDE